MIAKPIPHHPYHAKSDAMLRYIIKDAGEAAYNMRHLDYAAECKYLDQINDASTVLRWRANERAVSHAEVRRANHAILDAVHRATRSE